MKRHAIVLLAVFLGGLHVHSLAANRTVVSLDGEWEMAEGGWDKIPDRFEHRAPVPGLADMATPPFSQVGETNQPRAAFWYRKTFQIRGKVPEVASLKLHKAAYGARVYLNGQMAGEHLPCFTPGYFNLRPWLKGQGAANELVVRVGAFRTAIPENMPDGWDFEKTRYLPGLFDSVEVILARSPFIVRVQVNPRIDSQTARIQACISNASSEKVNASVDFTVREARSGQTAGQGKTDPIQLLPGEERVVTAEVVLKNCQLWSPESPFLYELETRTAGDALRTRFGMREFCLDHATGRAFLNGRPYFLRGSNVTLYRFFEDPQRGDRPWRTEWVRRLHQQFRSMHWNALRYCIGFPPKKWYEVADEEGFLIQDEFPLWSLARQVEALSSEELIRQYTEWMQERWNHPCVVIWDAQNETQTAATGKAIQAVRQLDLSGRPWDNGWAPPQAPGDVYESHPYLFSNPSFKLGGLAQVSGIPRGNPVPNESQNPILINEYGWLWLNRDGTPTTLTRAVYQNLLGRKATPEQCRHLYARYLAALTEFWRCHRACAGVLHFCGLGYSRPDGQTSDHFIDLENLQFEPEFARYVRDAFAPVGLMIDEWAETQTAGLQRQVPVAVINDLPQTWRGEVRLQLKSGAVVWEQSQPCILPALGEQRVFFELAMPTNGGAYQLEAALVQNGSAKVRSLRDFEVVTEQQKRQRGGLAFGKNARASSSATVDGISYPARNAFDGQTGTRWSSEFSDNQWVEVDLGELQLISRVELAWEAAYGKSYALQVSTDGKTWQEVFQTETGQGNLESIPISPVHTRWVRLWGQRRATPFGFSLWEMRVFGP